MAVPPSVSSEQPAAILAELRPSPPRRVVGSVILGILGFGLLYLGFATPTAALGWTVFLLVLGAVAVWLAWRMWQATEQGLVLTAQDLRATDGTLLVRVDQVRGISRGVFALKPAGGFTILTKSSLPRAWAPGLWWRAGRRIGIGGVTHRHEGRYMAEILADLVETRANR